MNRDSGVVPWRWATPATPGRSHFGHKIGMIAGAMGRPLMGWQRHVARVATELDPDTGEWAYPTVVLTVQRQAGKTTLIIPANIHECLRWMDSYAWYTSQTRQAARDNFLRDAKPLLRSRIASLVKLRKANGSEAIEVKATDSEYRIFAPGSDELHGKTNRRVTIDEAWAFSELEGIELMQSIVPTFTATAGQLWVVSTAGTDESVFLADWVAKGRAAVEAGDRKGIAYFECAVPPDVDPADLARPGAKRDALMDLVFANHPADGVTLKRSAVYAALSQMDSAEFLRAFGNRWTRNLQILIPGTVWRDAQDDRDADELPMPEAGMVAIGFDVDEDPRTGDEHAVIAMAWFEDEGAELVRVAIARAEPGARWLAGELSSLDTKWLARGIGANDYGPSAVAVDGLRRGGLFIDGINGFSWATACPGFLRKIRDRTLIIHHDPVLDEAASAATKRTLGAGWVWQRGAAGEPVTGLRAATAALWELLHAPGRFRVD